MVRKISDVDTHREILRIKREIIDIKQSQEANMQMNRENYEKFVVGVLSGKQNYARVFLMVDGLKSRREIQDIVPMSQPTVWRAINYLEKYGLILPLEDTKDGSPIYAKPRWVRVLQINDYVRRKILEENK